MFLLKADVSSTASTSPRKVLKQKTHVEEIHILVYVEIIVSYGRILILSFLTFNCLLIFSNSNLNELKEKLR